MSCGKLSIDSKELRDEWRSSRVDPWLRAVAAFASLFFHEQNAKRCLITGLPGKYGRIVELSVLSLPGVKVARIGETHWRPTWIVKRINVQFPFGDGDKETAVYDGAVIRLEVPFCGYSKESMAMRDWMVWGPKGKEMRPRKIRMVES